MARTFNKVTLIGNLGADPEARSLPSGAKVVQFNVATSESYKTKAGENVEQTTWFRAEAWDKLGDIAEQYLRKGNQVYLEGRLRLEEFTDRDGKARTALRLRVTEINLLGSRNEDSSSAPAGGYAPRAASTPAASAATPPPAAFVANGDADDLPF